MSAQSKTPFSTEKKITVYDGLSNNKITVIFQDSRGFIWFGTEDGLNRYDGYRMVIYRHEPLDTSSISGNLIQAINETPDGKIWVGTRNNGLSVWDRKTDKFTRFSNDPKDPSSLPENEICSILVTEYGRVWLKTRIFLVQFNNDNSTFSSYGHYSNLFKPDRIFHYPLIEDKGGTLWVGTKDGLNKFDISDKTFVRELEHRDGYDVGNELINDMLKFNDSLLFVLTPSGIKIFNSKKSKYEVVGNFKGLKNANVIYHASNNTVWFGTKQGLFYLKNVNGYKALESNPLLELKLIDDEITSIHEDKSNILWIGTKHKGIYKFNQNSSKFYSISKKNPYNLESYNVTSIFSDSDNYLWIGTSDKGVYRINRSNFEVEEFSLVQNTISNGNIEDCIFSIYKDHTGKLWFGTNHGLYFYNDKSNTIEEFDYCNNKEFSTLLKDNSIRAIEEDNLNNLWLGTKFGLYKYDGKNLESFFSEFKDTTSLCDDEINALMNDQDGWLWIGTNLGVNIYRPSEGTNFIRLKNSALNPFILSNNYILSLTDDLNGNIWIGTRSGLTLFDKKTNSTKNFFKKDGFENDVINGVLTDDMGRVWVSTNKGISLLALNGSVLNFSKNDGLAGYVFNVGAVHKGSDGELFFGGFDGVSYLYPGLIELNLVQPNVSITSITVYNKGEVSRKWTGEVNQISYKYQKNSSIIFEYSGLEFTQPLKNRYRVFLEGFDDNWRPISYQNSITYSNLPPGTYTLRIKGSNSDFVWNNKPYELNIKIKPPLWKSNYAYVFYLIVFVFLLQVVINFRVRYYRKAYQSLKEKAVDKKKIEAQKEALSKINKSLTDSINYAKRIQEGMLPTDQMVKTFINESFIYYRPKDIVSGDFYYFFKRDAKQFIAAVDCTGHGVPGAFMSIIGNDLLRNIIEIQSIEEPDEILNNLNRQLLRIFKKDMIGNSGLHFEVNDGMDLSLVVIDSDLKQLSFAGANNSMYLVRDNEIESFSGDRYSIGYNDSRDLFSCQEIPYNQDDVIYIFSDGYVDQFGGPEGKKFKYRRFRHLLLNIHKLPFEDQKAILHQKMEEWMGETNEQIDDMLLIGLKI